MIYPIRSIVAGVAELEGPDSVLAAGIELSARTGASLHLVHAYDRPAFNWSPYAPVERVAVDAIRDYRAAMQSRLEARVRGITRSPRVHFHAVEGPAAPTIRELAGMQDADLILVGATRRGAVGRTVLGTTAQRVLRGAPAPVLVLRGALPVPLRRVLFGTDLSTFSAGIHEIGLDVLDTLFAGDDPELRCLFVAGYSAEFVPSVGERLPEDPAERELREFLGLRRARSRCARGRIRVGDPAREILAEAAGWDASLVVVGTHGRTGPGRWLMGSVAESAVRGTTVSVLVIPARLEVERNLPVRGAHSMELSLPRP